MQNAFLKIESTHQQALILRDSIVPDAIQTVDASRSEYRSGKIEFLTLIDNWRKLLNFQLMYEHTLSSLEQNIAELEEAVGEDITDSQKQPDAMNPDSPSTTHAPDSPNMEGTK